MERKINVKKVTVGVLMLAFALVFGFLPLQVTAAPMSEAAETFNVTTFGPTGTSGTLQYLIANAPRDGTVRTLRIMNDINMTSEITIPANTNITIISGGGDVSLTRNSGSTRHFNISNNSTLTLGREGDAAANHISLTRTSNLGGLGGGVTVSNGGTFTMFGGTISNNRASSGGGVTVSTGGTFTMNGGTISGNTATSNGGGVSVSGTFTMHGGTISDNTANIGGGVTVNSGGTFTMNAGYIIYNHAHFWHGGVSGEFTRNDGVISNNTPADDVYYEASVSTLAQLQSAVSSAPRNTPVTIRIMNNINMAGVISIPANANITIISGGSDVSLTRNSGTGRHFTISNNGTLTLGREGDAAANRISLTRTANLENTGGGVAVNTGGTFTMYGGTISENTANIGGGVSAFGTFTMYGGTISGNTATSGGGVHVTGTFTMNAGYIIYNNAQWRGGVYGEFTRNGGVISNNTPADDVNETSVSTFPQLQAAVSSAPRNTPVTIRIMNNIDMTGAITIPANTNIAIISGSGDVSLTRNSGTARHFSISNNGTLTLGREGDAAANRISLTRTANLGYIIGGGVTVNNGGTFTMFGGTISENSHGVNVSNGGTFTMHGGIISGNTHMFGGVTASGTFTMYGGTISGNTANIGGGGGVNVGNLGTFTMNGGTISENTANIGGGVHVTGTFTMNAGYIIYNNAHFWHGGVSGEFTRNGGVISNNTPADDVNEASVSTFAQLQATVSSAPRNTPVTIRIMNNIDMTGAITIPANANITIISGGGDVSLTRNSGTAGHFNISNNGSTLTLGREGDAAANRISLTRTANLGNIGGGVNIFSGGTFVMYGGTISNNRASSGGGGVNVNNTGTFTRNGGIICGNSPTDVNTFVCTGCVLCGYTSYIPPSNITPATPPPSIIGIPYSQQFTADGDAPITWTLLSGTLPPGLTLSSDGLLSGTPTQAGTFTFVIEARNNGGYATREFTFEVSPQPEFNVTATVVPPQGGSFSGVSLTQGASMTFTATPNSGWAFEGWFEGGVRVHANRVYSFNVTRNRVLEARFAQVNPPSSIVTDSFAGGIVGIPYPRRQMSATGVAPVAQLTWTRVSGDLPPGLTLSSAGVLSGTPTQGGTFNFTVEARNIAGYARRDYSMVIHDLPVTVAVAPPNGGRVYGTAGTPVTLSAVPNFGWWFSGWYENDARISANSEISFSVTANRALEARFTQIPPTEPTPPSAIFPATLPPGIIGIPYHRQFTTNGTTPITWTMVSGELPPGLTFTSGGVLSGTPAQTGTFNFTIEARNSLGYVTQMYNMVVSEQIPGYSISVSAVPPHGGSVSGSAVDGDTVTLTATPNSGWRFEGWFEGGTMVYQYAEYSFTVAADRTLEARFETDFNVPPTGVPSIAAALAAMLAFIGVSAVLWSAFAGKAAKFERDKREGNIRE